MNARLYFVAAWLTLALGAAAQTSGSTNSTVFAMVTEGDRFIPQPARDKVVSIHSEKSSGAMVPDIWYVDYFDSTVPFKTTEVKFTAGQISRITHPTHVSGWFTGTRPLDWKKVKIDSDRALALALKDPDLKKLDLQATQFWLERTPTGSTWKIRFWAKWPAGITDKYVSSRTGEILKTEGHWQKQ